MTDQEKTTKDFTFDISTCLAMMEKMMGEHGAGCDCAEMMSQTMSQQGIPEEWRKVMSQMMEMHCGPQSTEQTFDV